MEVKSAIPAEPVRLGTPEAADAVLDKLGKAFKQIDVTAQLIADRDPALAAVPADRPVLGLAVTLEPFHMANAQFDPLPSTRTPVTVADAAEIENLVTITDMAPGQLLLDRAADTVRSTWPLDTALQGHARSRNPVLDEGMEFLPLGISRPRIPLNPRGTRYAASGHPGARMPSRWASSSSGRFAALGFAWHPQAGERRQPALPARGPDRRLRPARSERETPRGQGSGAPEGDRRGGQRVPEGGEARLPAGNVPSRRPRRRALTATSWTSSGTRSRPAFATWPPGSPPGACSQGTTSCCSTTRRPPAYAIPPSRPSQPTTRHGRAGPSRRATTCSTRGCSHSAISVR